MTPFDPVVLESMLRAFYPVVSGAELLRARRERPDYFAGGTIIGRCPDALRLPDGVVWDLIFNCDGPEHLRRWQAIIPGPAPDDPFPLEPGPLTPIDSETILPPAPFVPIFEPLVAEALGELGAADGAIGAHVQVIADAADPVGLDAEFEDTIGRAAATLEGDAHAFDALDIASLSVTTDGHIGVIRGRDAEILNPADAPPGYEVPDPGTFPDGPAPPGKPTPDEPLPPPSA